MPKIEYRVGAEESLDKIKPLWEKLNEQHARDSAHFSAWFRKRGFAERKESVNRRHPRAIYLEGAWKVAFRNGIDCEWLQPD